tara:strand:+ start:134 stop:394 length:261 start_codon:yes stop_codon:yes gene_type:complete
VVAAEVVEVELQIMLETQEDQEVVEEETERPLQTLDQEHNLHNQEILEHLVLVIMVVVVQVQVIFQVPVVVLVVREALRLVLQQEQ